MKFKLTKGNEIKTKQITIKYTVNLIEKSV